LVNEISLYYDARSEKDKNVYTMSVPMSVRHRDRPLNHLWATNRRRLEESYENFQYIRCVRKA